MKQSKFKPGQQWLSRDGKQTFHILSFDRHGGMDCVCIEGDWCENKIWFYANGRYYRFTTDNFDLVTLIKDVE